MGNANAKNEANAIVQAGINITNSAITSCTTTGQQGVSIYCLNCPRGCEITHDVISQSQYLKASCFQTASAVDNVTQQVTQAIMQKAAAVSAGFGLSGADASNVVNASINAAIHISNTFSDEINTIQTQQVALEGCDISYDQIKQNVNDIEAAAQVAGFQNTAQQAVSQSITQTATAVNLGLLGIILAILLVVIIIAIAFAVVGKEAGQAAQTTAKIILPVGLVAGVGYLGLAWWYSWAPFPTKSAAGALGVLPEGELPTAVIGQSATYTFYIDPAHAQGDGNYTWTVYDQSNTSGSNQFLHDLGFDVIQSGQRVQITTDWQGGPNQVQQPPANTQFPNPVIFTVYVTDGSRPAFAGQNTYTLNWGTTPSYRSAARRW